MEKDYSKLNKQLIMIDLSETSDEPDTLAGVAIRAEDMEAFLADVERLAVEKYNGATFLELMDEDLDDASITAAHKQFFEEQKEAMYRALEKLFGEGA